MYAYRYQPKYTYGAKKVYRNGTDAAIRILLLTG